MVMILAAINVTAAETVSDSLPVKHHMPFFKSVGKVFSGFINSFSNVDTTFIEPQHYNYTVMLQNTNAYESYTLRSKDGQSITFAPEPSVKIGPYFGWRWIFLGYTFDVNHISGQSKKTEFDFSFYTQLFGIDLYYKKYGNDFRIRTLKMPNEDSKFKFKDVPFNGMTLDTKGFDLYYIFNHKKFSYPAAYAQSTMQKKSCGSALLGIGYMYNSISLNHEKLAQTINDYVQQMPGYEYSKLAVDSGLMFNRVTYSSFSISGGYTYNWVFTKNCLFNASLSVAVAYKHSEGDNKASNKLDFDFKNFNFDGVGRFGIVWNNNTWFVGANYVIRSYYYHKNTFSTNNYIGKLNIYAGLNFGKRKQYRNKNN